MNSFDELEQAIKKWLYIPDPYLIRVVAATVIANYMPGDPVWLFIVAASGGTKTELLRGLDAIDDIHMIADLTPQTLMSGLKGKGSGLLERLGEFSIIVMKDFTTVLTMNHDKRHAIMGQLREIYDGYLRKEFGNVESRTWAGKLGFIAGVTTVIDQQRNVYHMLGERFIQYRPELPDRLMVTRRALANLGKEAEMRQEIQDAFLAYISSVPIPKTNELPTIPENYQERVLHLAAFCAWARSGVVRDGYGNQDISFIPDVEIPTRLVKQFSTLFTALAVMRGEFTDADYELIYKVAMDSLPTIGRNIVKCIFLSDRQLKPSEIAEAVHCPLNTVRKRLEDFAAIGLLTAESDGEGLPTYYQLAEEARTHLQLASAPNDVVSKVDEIFFDGKGLPEKSIGSIPDSDIPTFPADQTELL